MHCLRNKIVASIPNKCPVITFEVTYKIKNNIRNITFCLGTFCFSHFQKRKNYIL